MSVGARMRCEVFKRDKFTCQYCGRKSPDVILHVDHITPVASGGCDDILNLVTSCIDCNLGKSDRPLRDNVDLEVRRRSMEQLEERRQQLAMLRDWHVSLSAIDCQAALMLWDVWTSLTGVSSQPSDDNTASLIQLLKKYSFEEIAQGMRDACSKHISPSSEIVETGLHAAFEAISRQCWIAKTSREDPIGSRKRYIIGILRNRVCYVNTRSAAALIGDALNCGVDIGYVEDAAKQAKSWSSFRDTIYDACGVCDEQYDDEEGSQPQ
jgi:hypothetical protein